MQRINPVGKLTKKIGKIGMRYRLSGFIHDKVLLRHIGHVIALIIFGKQVIEGLIAMRAAFLGDGTVPFLGIRKLGVDVKDNTAKRVFLVPDNLAKMIFCVCLEHNLRNPHPALVNETPLPVHDCGPESKKQSVNLFLTVFQVVAPVFILGAVGFAWVRLGFEYRVQFVTRLSMTLAVPCLIFVALMQTEIEAAALGKLLIASVVAYTGVSIAVFFVIKLNGLSIRTYLAPLIFGNTGNLGLPLALFAFGDAGLAYAVVVFAVMIIFAFTFGLWTVSGAGSPLVMLKEPLFGATVLGGVFLIWDLETPIWLTNALDLIGQMGIPLMLITLGVAVARLTPTGIYRAVALSLVKVVICTAIAWMTGGLVRA